VWHDHQPLCPRLTFLDSEQRYCGETDASRCVSCLASTSAPYEWVKIEDWRERFRAYLAGAEVVSAPSEAAALRARRLVDVSKVTVDPHPEPHLTGVRPLKRRREGESNGASPPKRPRNGNGSGNGKRHVLILGAIGPHKGAYLIHAMIKDIRARKLPLHMDILGYTALSEIATGPGVTVHGKYHGDADALKRIGEIGPDLCLVSSVWPETYLFTLSVPMALHLPTVAFDIGAQAERVAAYDRGVVLDEHLMEDPVSLNDALLELDVEALWSTPVNVDFRHACALSAYFSSRARSPGGEGPADRPRREAPRDRGSGAPSGDWMSVLH